MYMYLYLVKYMHALKLSMCKDAMDQAWNTETTIMNHNSVS